MTLLESHVQVLLVPVTPIKVDRKDDLEPAISLGGSRKGTGGHKEGRNITKFHVPQSQRSAINVF